MANLKFGHGDSTCSKKFSFMDYDVIGFDLDNCLCRYNLTELFKLEYNVISSYLINTQKFPKDLLTLPYEQGKDFVMKGLFLDLKKGNILKVSDNGRILKASHGSRQMEREEIERIYPNSHWTMTDKYVNEPLSVWLGEATTEIQALTDYFDLPVSLIYARLIDNLDKNSENKYNEIFPEILNCLYNMYGYDQFKNNGGGYYPAISNAPSKYILPNEPHIINWIKKLRSTGKKIFLLSGSNIDYGRFIAEKSLGSEWNELFDIKMFKGRKPGFWNLDRPFLSENEPTKHLKLSESYMEGNYDDLSKFLSEITKKASPKILYIGDSIVQDVFAPNKYCGLDTVAIVEEIEAEGVFGYDKITSEECDAIQSDRWGSFFADNNEDTIWKQLIMKHSVFFAPSISVLAEKPADHIYNVFK